MRVKRRIVGVIGSGESPHPELAAPVGRLAAILGCHLLTGGGGGVMAEASRAFCEVEPRDGLCLGVLKGRTEQCVREGRPALSHVPAGPNPWVEVPLLTHLPLSGRRGREEGSRNHIIVLSADVLVALPGGEGTFSEVTLRLAYGRRIVFFLGEGSVAGHPAGHFHRLAGASGRITEAGSMEDLEQLLRQELALLHAR